MAATKPELRGEGHSELEGRRAEQMSAQWLRIAAGRCLFLAAAVQAACVGGEAAERQKLREAWEDLCFQAASKGVHELLVALNEGLEGKDHDLDPFSPEHMLSQGKPEMKSKPIPDPKEGVPTREVKIGKAIISALIPPDLEPDPPPGSGIAIFRNSEVCLAITRSAVSVVDLELPKELREKLSKAPAFVDAHAVERELKRLKAMPEFDLLAAIKTCDVDAFGPGVPFARRITGLLLFGLKTTFGCGRHGCQYYEGQHMRCFVTGPYEHTVTTLDSDTGKPLRKEEEIAIDAEFAFREHDCVFWLRLVGSKPQAARVTLEEALTFLANCKLKSVERAGTEPGK